MNQASPHAQAPSPRVVHDRMPAYYASQFLVTVTEDEMLVDCAPGLVGDPAQGDMVLPVHTRLALSKQGARRLIAVLTQALEQYDRHCPAAPSGDLRGSTVSATASPAMPQAQLPRLCP
jgi:hypothetical protein